MTDIEPMAAVRAVHIAATIAIAGALAFRLLVLPRSSPASPGVGGRERPAVVATRWTTSWCGVALAVAIATWLAWLVLAAAGMSGTALAQMLAGDVLGIVLARTTFGHVWIVRSACMLALVAWLVVVRRRDHVRVTAADATAACLALPLLLTLAGTGHAIAGEASQRLARVSIDALHLLGAGAWLGALVPLLFVLGRAAGSAAPAWHLFAAAAVRRFSVLGVVAVVLLLGSGLSNAVSLVGSWTALADTPYGRLVEAKVALFALILAIAAVNRLRWTPRLDAPATEPRALRALRRNAIVELAIGAAIVCIVGVLGVRPPPAHEDMAAMHAAP